MNDLVVNKLAVMNKLLGILVTKDLEQIQAISMLSKAGLAPKEIAEVLGTSAAVVSVTLVRLKKKKSVKRK